MDARTLARELRLLESDVRHFSKLHCIGDVALAAAGEELVAYDVPAEVDARERLARSLCGEILVGVAGRRRGRSQPRCA